MARVLIDTNVLAHRLNRGDPEQATARRALKALRSGGNELCLVPRVIYELYVVLTRTRTARNGLGLAPSQANRLLNTVVLALPVLPDTSQVMEEWRRLVTIHNVAGVPAHDARLVAAMKVQGLSHILTFNTSDFVRYGAEGIVVTDATSF